MRQSARPMTDSRLPEIYVDGDACPVKAEAVRVAERHGLVLHLVSNQWLRGPESPCCGGSS